MTPTVATSRPFSTRDSVAVLLVGACNVADSGCFYSFHGFLWHEIFKAFIRTMRSLRWFMIFHCFQLVLARSRSSLIIGMLLFAVEGSLARCRRKTTGDGVNRIAYLEWGAVVDKV
uniref:Uncharacterized protein n=1 Tax=Cacopsylla melanoneura TaxID=428564 RepID=A0A8D8XJX1_9HEMI